MNITKPFFGNISTLSGTNFLFVISVLIIFSLLGINAFLAMEPPVDDAYIVYRYVDRFLDGKGFSYNDKDFVEGSTSLLWMLLLSAVSCVGIPPHIASIWINYFLILMTGFALIWLLQILNIKKSLILFALILYANSLFYFKVVYLGLEFGFYGFAILCLLGLIFQAKGYEISGKKIKYFAILIGLAGALIFVIRPEAIFIFPGVMFGSFLIGWMNKRSLHENQVILYSFFSFFLLSSIVTIGRFLYFGDILPNSAVAKLIPIEELFVQQARFSRKEIIQAGVSYVCNSYVNNPFLLVSIFVVVFALWKRLHIYEILIFLIPFSWQHIIALYNGGDWMNYYRFIYVGIPLVIVLLIIIVANFESHYHFPAKLFLFLILGLILFTNVRSHLWEGFPNLGLVTNEPDSFVKVGNALNDIWIKNDIIISEVVGRLAYVMPNAKVLDSSGLLDRDLARDRTARRSVFGRLNWHYLLNLDPAVITLHHRNHQYTWEKYGVGYPENYAIYCLPPTDELRTKPWVFIIIRKDRTDIYGSKMIDIGAHQVKFEMINNQLLSNDEICLPD